MEGNKRNESNISNEINTNTRNDYTTWVWLLWISYEVNSTIFINNTLFWFRLNILLNEFSSLTFWNRFGISNYNPYSIFWSTYQCHQNNDTETPSFRTYKGCSIWKIYIQSFQTISLLLRIVNEHESSSSHLSPLFCSIRYHNTHIAFCWFHLLAFKHS